MTKKESHSEAEIARALATSDGNAFHARVATLFRNWGWTVHISPYYVDNATGQAREIDLLCEKVVMYPQGTKLVPERGVHVQVFGMFHIQLFVECKYLKEPVVFWFDECDQQRRDEWLRNNTPFKPSLKHSLYQHRYMTLGSQVAKLFRSGDAQDPIYKGLAQSLGALIQRGRTSVVKDLPPGQGGLKGDDVLVQYPVIVCSDNAGFYRTHIGDDPAETELIDPMLLLEVDYAYSKNESVVNKYFLVDVLQFKKLESFLKRLHSEAAEAAAVLGS